MKHHTTLQLLVILTIVAASGCGLLQKTTCDSVADVLHDTSLFICKLSSSSETPSAAATQYTQQLLDVQLRALALAPPSAERDDLIKRCALARVKLEQ